MKKFSSLLRKLLDKIPHDVSSNRSAKTRCIPLIIKRENHTISRKDFTTNTCKVLYRLHNAGFQAYLVGGGIRDLLLGLEPKDFDIVTDAKPEQIRKIFRNCRLIGRRFRLAHIYFKDEIIEVATFRADENEQGVTQRKTIHGLLHRDNIYGTLDDDIWRRDFTINAIYYNIADFTLVDYSGGLQDLSDGIIRIIGNPEQRFREDPVRMIRAIRFAAKLGMRIDDKIEQALPKCRELLYHVSPSRLFDESLKLFMSGYSSQVFAAMHHYTLFETLYPELGHCLRDKQYHLEVEQMLLALFKNTDNRISAHKPVTPAYLYAALLWYPLMRWVRQYQADGCRNLTAMDKAIQKVIAAQNDVINIPKKFVYIIREIWLLQHQLQNHRGKRPYKLLHQQRFRAAYDFLLLRSEADQTIQPIAHWWTTFIDADENQREKMTRKNHIVKQGKKNNATTKQKDDV